MPNIYSALILNDYPNTPYAQWIKEQMALMYAGLTKEPKLIRYDSAK